MSHQPTTSFSPEALPPEWQAELDQLPKGSAEYKDFVHTLGELGLSTELQIIDLTDGPKLPNGFVSQISLNQGATLPLSQFEGKVHALTVDVPVVKIDVTELQSDTGSRVRVGDLRPLMADSLKKVGPKSSQERKRLDDAFWRDMKIYADTGVMRNTVATSPSVGYTRVGGTKLRTYWTAVKDLQNAGNVRTVVRLGDSGDNVGLEAKLYHKLFDAKL